MPHFESDGLSIAYEISGSGRPVLLIHGFASNGDVNWVETGWVNHLVEQGYQTIAIDNRGHGRSDKPYDSAAYPAATMAKDSERLLDHLGLDRVSVLGYSMGARIGAFLTLQAPGKVSEVIFGGMGINMVRGMSDSSDIVAALEAPALSDIPKGSGRAFRIFAEHTKSDLRALAACMGSSRQQISESDVQKIVAPSLVAVGTKDEVAGSASELQALLPAGELLDIVGRDHMRATGDKVFKDGVLEFLNKQPHL